MSLAYSIITTQTDVQRAYVGLNVRMLLHVTQNMGCRNFVPSLRGNDK